MNKMKSFQGYINSKQSYTLVRSVSKTFTEIFQFRQIILPKEPKNSSRGFLLITKSNHFNRFLYITIFKRNLETEKNLLFS